MTRFFPLGLGLLLLAPFAGAQSSPAIPAAPPASATQLFQTVEQESAKLEAEKRRVAAEKKSLAPRSWQSLIPPFFHNRRQALTTEQVASVRQKEDAVRSKALALHTKREMYELMTAIVERKLVLLNLKPAPLPALDEELRQLANHRTRVERLHRTVDEQITKSDQEIASLEQHIQAQRALAELKPQDAAILQETIQTQQERLTTLHDTAQTFTERRDLYDHLLDVIRDDTVILQEKQRTRLMEELLTADFGHVNWWGALAWGLVLYLLVLGRRWLPRLREWARTHEETRSRLWQLIAQLTLYGGFLACGGYLLAVATGFHNLAHFVGVRILQSFSLLLGCALLHTGAMYGVKSVLVTRWRRSPGGLQNSLRILAALFGWSLAGGAVIWVIRIWGTGHEGTAVLWHWLNVPLTTIGTVEISSWLLLKIALTLWLFSMGARIVEHLLRTHIYPHTRLDEGVRFTMSVAVRYCLLIIGGFTGLGILGIDLSALTVLAGTVGIGVGFGLQEIAKNFISGVVMLIERPVKIGDFIEIGGLPGRVRAIKARSTVVDTNDNISVLVPNAEFMTQKVVNWSYSDRIIRIVNTIGVAYGTDVELVKATLLRAAEHPNVLASPPPIVRLDGFGDSAMNFSLAMWTSDLGDRTVTRSEVNFAIERLFREAGIRIPFPQREVLVRKGE